MPRFNRWGSRRRPKFQKNAPTAIKETSGVQVKQGHCFGCNSKILPGENYVRFMLAKRYRVPCASCNTEPRKARRYHDRCRPADVNKAMGFDPTAHVHNTYVPPPPSAAQGIPPPPKPPTADELGLTAVLALEAALIARLRENPALKTDELRKKFKTFQNVKSRVLRPGTDEEGDTATAVAMKQLITIVYSTR